MGYEAIFEEGLELHGQVPISSPSPPYGAFNLSTTSTGPGWEQNCHNLPTPNLKVRLPPEPRLLSRQPAEDLMLGEDGSGAQVSGWDEKSQLRDRVPGAASIPTLGRDRSVDLPVSERIPQKVARMPTLLCVSPQRAASSVREGVLSARHPKEGPEEE